jgi:hypothetical protein
LPATATPSERFWSKVQKTADCWVWKASVAGPGKYGHFHVSGGSTAAKGRVRVYAHRWSYEEVVGPIPDGLELDHLCRNPRCVNPAHLEPVTHAENHRRRRGFRTGPYNVGDACRHGHPRNAENTGINAYGYRFCRPCARAKTARYAQKRRQQ